MDATAEAVFLEKVRDSAVASLRRPHPDEFHGGTDQLGLPLVSTSQGLPPYIPLAPTL